VSNDVDALPEEVKLTSAVKDGETDGESVRLSERVLLRSELTVRDLLVGTDSVVEADRDTVVDLVTLRVADRWADADRVCEALAVWNGDKDALSILRL